MLIRVLVWVFAAVQVLGYLLAWSSYAIPDLGFRMQWVPKGILVDEALALGLSQRLLGAGLGGLSLALLLAGLWCLDRLLRNLPGQSIFSLHNIANLRRFAGAAGLSTAMGIAELPLRALLGRYLLGNVDLSIKVQVSSEQLFVLLICGVFYVLADLMHEARRLAEENEAFV